MSVSVTVSPGDTLSKLSLMYTISPSRLIEINKLENHEVRPGQILKLESPLEYLSSRHQVIVMLISSSDFFKERENIILHHQDIDDGLPPIDSEESLILKTAISVSIVLTEDLIILNQLQSSNSTDKEKYTVYLNLTAIASTTLVPFYKPQSDSNDQEKPRKDDFETAKISSQKSSGSFFKRFFQPKNETDVKKPTGGSYEESNGIKPKKKRSNRDLDDPVINYGGTETFSGLYNDEPSILELCVYDDPLNKNMGTKSISFFASRAELNALDFLINFFSKQRRIEIGLKISSPIISPSRSESEEENLKLGLSASMPIPQISRVPKKSSLISIVQVFDETTPNFGIFDEAANRVSSKLVIDAQGSFGFAIQNSVSFVSDSRKAPKRHSKSDRHKKSANSESDFMSSPPPLSSPQIVTKSTLSTLAPISCQSLKLSSLSLNDSLSFTDNFSYSQYSTSLTDSTSFILDVVNITMIRANFPHRAAGSPWRLAFRLSRDGCSFHSLLDKTKDGHACVLAILTSKGERIGAFFSEGIKDGKNKSNAGNSFVFTFMPTEFQGKSKKRNVQSNRETSKNKSTPNASSENSKKDENNNNPNTNESSHEDNSNNDNKNDNSNNNNNDNSNNNNNNDSNSSNNNNNDNSNNNNNNDNSNNNSNDNTGSVDSSDITKVHILINESMNSSYFRRRSAAIYKWSTLNNNFVSVTTTDLMIGSTLLNDDKDVKDRSVLFANYRKDFAGRYGAAIWIDQKMSVGISERCPTFNSPPLVESGTFHISDIEIWNIV